MKTPEQSYQHTKTIYDALTVPERAKFIEELAWNLGDEYVHGFIKWLRDQEPGTSSRCVK